MLVAEVAMSAAVRLSPKVPRPTIVAMRCTLPMVVVCLLAGRGIAGADGVVLESYAGARPADADGLLAPLRDELGLRGFSGGAQLARTITAKVSAEAPVLDGEAKAELRKLVASGTDQFREGQYDAAVRDLVKAMAMLDRAPATMVADAELRNEMMDALVFLTTAYTRQGKAAEATRTMAELIRSFPDKEISNARHGPEPRKLHDKVKADLDSQGTGSLRVTVDDARTVVFVNERYAGVGSLVVDKLPPGRYRVFVQQGTTPGRMHRIEVEAGSEAVLTVAWGLDSALGTRGDFVGFTFAAEAERAAGESTLANRMARAVGADGVVVVGIREVQGRRAIVGAYLSVDSTRPLRSAALAADPVAPAQEKIRALARFLAGDESAKGEVIDLLENGNGDSPGPGPEGPKPGGGGKGWKWGLTIGGGLALATGVVLIAIAEPEEKDGARNPDARATLIPGIIVGGVGAVAAGVGTYLLLTHKSGDDRRVGFAPTDGGAMVTFGGVF